VSRPVARTLLRIALVAALFAVPAPAQVRGQVVDASGRPLREVTVELWAASRAVAATRTDDAGRFAITAPEGDAPLLLTARRLGLWTQTVRLTSRDTSLALRMEARPVRLAAVTVASPRPRTCPNRDDPGARALWERMRSRYWQPSDDTVAVFGFMELRTGTGEKADAHRPEAGRVSPGWTTGALVVAHPELMALSGYASRAAGGVGERTASWSYRALDDGAMQDFTGDYFGAAHTFSILGRHAGETTIAFCPRERMRRTGQIEGALVLRADTTLGWARWTFRTPRPDEDAGGESGYEPPDPALGRALLGRETVFWRKTSGGRYYFEAKTFTGWHLRDER
jgi:Carboxypeptidase regulatory-like domain